MAQKQSGKTLPQKFWSWFDGDGSNRTSYWLILGPTIALSFIGIVMVLSASSVEYIGGAGSFASLKSQGIFGIIGLVVMVIMGRLKPGFYRQWSWLFMLLAIFLLLLVLTPLGVEVNGNRNWIRLGGLSFQPAEGAKLALAVWGGHTLARRLQFSTKPKQMLFPVVFPGATVIIVLVMLGRDLGTVLIFLMILAALLLLAGFPTKYFTWAALLGTVGVLIATFTSDNRAYRVKAWLGQCDIPGDPCYQYDQGIYALASGGWWGVGLGQSRQKWSYLPEAENDFIFTILGEELGLLGCLLVIGLYIALAIGMFRVAYRTDSTFIRITTGTIMVWILGQAFLNIAMVVGLLPVIGVPLPFISAGGSALIMSQLAMGVLLSFARQERREIVEADIDRELRERAEAELAAEELDDQSSELSDQHEPVVTAQPHLQAVPKAPRAQRPIPRLRNSSAREGQHRP